MKDEKDTTPYIPDVKHVQVPVTVLENCTKVIDAAAQRGAFHGYELSTVGNVRDLIQSLIEK